MAILSSKQNNAKNKELYEFTNGIGVDQRLAAAEIKVQKAWVKAILDIGIIKESDATKLITKLNQAYELMKADTFPWRIEDEDIHMNLERFITEDLGEIGKKIHIGRSRNDLIATTLRLQVKIDITALQVELKSLIETFINQAETNLDIIMPGFTHLQAGQPVRLSHILTGYIQAFSRDLKKTTQVVQSAMEYLPLGSAALGGTTLNLDLCGLAKELGFLSFGHNAYDAVSDRDYLLESLFFMGQISIHLSRLSEDLIIWASPAFRLITLPTNWSTGSSIMPNKRNPDVPELIRAKSARILAGVTQAQTLMKALPSSYNTDLHELKKIYFETLDLLRPCLKVMTSFIEELKFSKKNATILLKHGHLLATDLANALTEQGLSFRDAYQLSSVATFRADEKNLQVHELSLEDFQQLNPSVNWNLILPLSFLESVEKKCFPGGTSQQSIQKSLQQLKREL